MAHHKIEIEFEWDSETITAIIENVSVDDNVYRMNREISGKLEMLIESMYEK